MVLALTFGAPAATAAPVTFASPQAYPAGSGPKTVAMADLDHDGNLDLAVATFSNNVSVLLGDGSGQFDVETVVGLGGGERPSDIAVGDVNGDGDPDIVVANEFTDDVSVLLGDGTGGFSATAGVTAGDGPSGVALADLDEDGTLDLVVSNLRASVTLALGQGDGSFTPAPSLSFADVGYPTGLAVADVDEDGHVDLVVTLDGTGAPTAVLLGDGDGGFDATDSVPGVVQPFAVAVADLDGDSHRDLAIVNKAGSGVNVALGDGTGHFAVAQFVLAGALPVAIEIADFDSDGRPDLATVSEVMLPSQSVAISVGIGSGQFAEAGFFPGGGVVTALAAGDVDGDGDIDLAVTNRSAGTVTVLLNTTDITAPETSIESGPSGPTASVDASFAFSSSESGGVVRVSPGRR